MLKNKGITLVALVITIIILLILAGISISAIGGESGIFSKTKQAKESYIGEELKEQLILALQETQLEKSGKVTLNDITQEWAESKLSEYEPRVMEDTQTDGKMIIMKKDDVIRCFLIDAKLNIKEIEAGIIFAYVPKDRIDNKVNIMIYIQDIESGLRKIEIEGQEPIEVTENKKDEKQIPYQVEIGKEYKVKITTENGKVKEEKIKLDTYWHKVVLNLGKEVNIDNKETKAKYNNPYEATISCKEGYIIDTMTVTMGGNPVTADIATGVIDIEKVTGDIEITATTKKLQIEYTAIAVSASSSASNTTSLGANTQTKGTKLYINIIAELEGTVCTVKLKDDPTKIVPYPVIKNGKYVFTVSGIYNGKTLKEEKEVIVNQFRSANNLVQYDAGEWTEDEIAELQKRSLYNININKVSSTETGLNFTFGGFTYEGDKENVSYIKDGAIITSRNQSVSPYNNGIPRYDGWQILSVETKKDESGEIIKNEDGTDRQYVTKIIHAGSPENYTWNR